MAYGEASDVDTMKVDGYFFQELVMFVNSYDLVLVTCLCSCRLVSQISRDSWVSGSLQDT